MTTDSGCAGGERAFRLTIAYDGTHFFGWQRQPHHPTVQAAVEQALCKLLNQPEVRVLGSSRTDTGVHAVGQVAKFKTANWPAEAWRLPLAINCLLPDGVVVRRAEEVPMTFHPLRDCLGKHYRYLVYASRIEDPILARTHWWVRRPLSLSAMQQAATHLLGRHDFYSFQSTGSPRKTTVRTVRRLEIHQQSHLDGHLVSIDIEADGFLYNMVRNIVGTLVQVGVGRATPDWVAGVLAARDRTVAGAAAPPQGLCLMQVFYPQ
ncbi:MAG: tRNA pseudouridine(38-40) synthase TruA [Planctomycetota bacterium]|nr:MAG: tRNA pseudouridine(38-40) synthase TruA [Planctomycetota bacterium]